MILTQGYLNKFEATGRKVQHLCPVQSFKVLTSLKDCLLHEGMILTCGLAGSRSLEGKVQKSCLSHIFLEKHYKFLLYTNVTFHIWVCQHFDKRSFGQVQCH